MDSFLESEDERKAFLEKVIDLHPLGRLAEPSDIARSILFLASDESSWITGIDLIVDGGLTAGVVGSE